MPNKKKANKYPKYWVNYEMKSYPDESPNVFIEKLWAVF
jgi:hypothetical protein